MCLEDQFERTIVMGMMWEGRCVIMESRWCYEAGKLCAHLLLVCRSEPGLGRRRTRALGGLQRCCHSTMRLLPILEMHGHPLSLWFMNVSASARRTS